MEHFLEVEALSLAQRTDDDIGADTERVGQAPAQLRGGGRLQGPDLVFASANDPLAG